MGNEKIIKEAIKKRGFSKINVRDIWTKGSWTIRFCEQDIEIFDSVEKSGRYFIDNVDLLDIRLILDEIEDIESK